MGASITLAGESLIAQKLAAQEGLDVARFIFANVLGLDHSAPVDRAAAKPAPAQIVYSAEIPDENAGFVNPNQVVYSVQVGSDVGDWDFNWIGLETDEGVLFAVAYVPLQQKRRNIPPLQIGNNVTRNFLLAFDGAQALTGITIDANTWQHDFTIRLAGIDERERQSNRDIYGRACFFGSALQLEKVGAVYQLKTGTAYVEGIRIVRSAVLPVVPPAFPTTAWLDVALQRELNDVVASWSVVWGAGKVDYVDSAGVRHYCVPVADLPTSDTITDRRPVEAINGPLIDHFAARVGNYEFLRARATTKNDVGLGNLPNAKTDDPGVNDSEVLATSAAVNAVQTAVQRLDSKNSVLFTTTGNVLLQGLGVQSGGDWSAPLPSGARVLAKDQASGDKNGLYMATAGQWVRAVDADTNLEVTPGLFVSVEQGTKHADSLWRLVTDGPITLDTTPLTFEMEAGRTGVAGGVYDLVSVNSRGQVVGGSKQGFVTLSSNTLLGNQHRGTVLLDASAGPRVFTLPEVNPALGVVDILLRRSDPTANALTLAATGADKIMHKTSLVPGGLSIYSLLYSGDYIHLRSDGAGHWWVIGTPPPRTVVSPKYDYVLAGAFSFAHDLKVEPSRIRIFYECKAADLGWSIGDVVDPGNTQYGLDGTSIIGVAFYDLTATGMNGRFGNSRMPVLPHRSNTTWVNATAGKWYAFFTVTAE